MSAAVATATRTRPRRCARKGCRALVEQPHTGRPRLYCRATCRVAAWEADQRRRAREARRRSVEWYTPPEVFAWFTERWGPFDLDPFTSPASPVWDLVEHHLTRDDDALTSSWALPGVRRAFANPPYGKEPGLGPCTERGARAVADGEVELVAYLVPLRPSSGWFRRAVEAGATFDPYPRRIAFLELTADGTLARTSGALFECTALVFRRG
jgi:hypothetical protein